MRMDRNDNSMLRWAVAVGDVMLLNIILLAFLLLWPDVVPPYFHRCTKITAICFNFSLIAGELLLRPIIHQRTIRTEDMLLHVFQLVAIHSLLAFIIVRLLCDGGGFFRFLCIFTFTEYILFALERFCMKRVLHYYRLSGRNLRQVLFVGNDIAVTQLYDQLLANPGTGYKALGYYSDEPIQQEPYGMLSHPPLLHLGTTKELFGMLESTDAEKKLKVDDIFCSLSHDESETIVHLMQCCDNQLIHFYYVPRMFGNYQLQLKPMMLGEFMLFTNHQEPLRRMGNKFIKRSFDIVMSSIVCLCLLPLIPIIALIIKLQTPGPTFFTQLRTGLNGKSFRCYKFRSRHMNAESDTLQASANDPRKFAFGDFMRRTNIDELPQFFNVLIGNMSVVGPRPHMLRHTEIYGKLIDKYMVRHFYKPGITGHAQVTGFRGETRELWQREERIKRDIWYIENWSIWLDLSIIWRTVLTIFVHDKHAY